jgi:large subunit ribosomal protein L6
MSRIGRKPVTIPSGVNITIGDNNNVTVKGPKGTLTKALPKAMNLSIEDGVVLVTRPTDSKEHRALHGLTRTLLANMVEGVVNGYSKELEINGVGYRAAKQGKKLVMNLGYSHQVEMEERDGITIEVPAPNKIIVSGIDKQAVGQFAANIREKRPPEP